MPQVLIVEDDRHQAHATRDLLAHLGFDSHLAETGAAALVGFEREEPDLILLDIDLPDLDGFEICRRIRSHSRGLRTPIILATGLGMNLRLHGLRVGANAYLTKPYVLEELCEAIDSVLCWREQMEAEGLVGEMQLELPSQVNLLPEANSILMPLLGQTRLSARQMAQMEQVLFELGQNAIEWGNRSIPGKLVQVQCQVYADRVEVTITDQGNGFQRDDLPHAASPDDPMSHLEVREQMGMRTGGFGLLICQGLTDELRYNEPGNQVTIVKYCDEAPVAVG